MNFLALLLGLALERMLTHLFHLREFRWLDPLFDAHLRRLRRANGGPTNRWSALALTGLLAALLVLPVALLAGVLQDQLLQIPYFIFAVVVLLFSLGPRDLDDEVEDYGDALETGDVPMQHRVAEELLETVPPALPAERNEAVERAIYVQANNRIFGVLFWFLLLGPGRLGIPRTDLLRHRAEARAETRATEPEARAHEFAGCRARTPRVLAWIPARLLILGYALAGNFEEALETWRNTGAKRPCRLPTAPRAGSARRHRTAGRGALDVADSFDALDRIRGARSLVMRTLWIIWCPVIAILTLYDWLT